MRRRRLLLFSLALALVPILVVSGPGVGRAAAAVRYSGTGVLNWHLNSPLLSDKNCSATAYYKTDGTNSAATERFVVANMTCSGPALNDTSDDTFEVSATGYTVGNPAETCFFPVTSSEFGAPVSLAPLVGSGDLPQSSMCRVTRICLTWNSVKDNWGDDVYEMGCVSKDYGVPEMPGAGGSCAFGKTGAPWHRIDPADGGRLGVIRVLETLQGQWGIAFVQKNVVTGVVRSRNDGSYWHTNRGVGLWDYWGYTYNNASSMGDWQIVGVQLAKVGGTGYPTQTQFQQLPQATAGGVLGTTKPGECRWYWGQKVAEVSNSDVDEPAGPLASADNSESPVPPGDVEPTPTNEPPGETGCTFEWNDPGTWASAGICALVELFMSLLDLIAQVLGVLGEVLGAIWDAIEWLAEQLAALFGAIWDGFTDLMSALFVPSEGFVQGQINGVKDAWDDAAPMVVVDMVSSLPSLLAVPSTGGCSGPGLSLDFGTSAGHTFHLLSTCDEDRARIANIANLALTVMVYMGAGLVALRLLMASFGLNTKIGGSDDD